MTFGSIKVGASFVIGGIEYVKTSPITAESQYAIALFDADFPIQ